MRLRGVRVGFLFSLLPLLCYFLFHGFGFFFLLLLDCPQRRWLQLVDSLWFRHLFSREFPHSRCANAFFVISPPPSPRRPLSSSPNSNISMITLHYWASVLKMKMALTFMCWFWRVIRSWFLVLLSRLWSYQAALCYKHIEQNSFFWKKTYKSGTSFGFWSKLRLSFGKKNIWQTNDTNYDLNGSSG